MITQDAPILGLLLACLALVFHTSRLPRFAKFYGIVPALLMAYFLPAILNSTGIIEAGEGSSLYYVASRYLLPASLIMFCLSIDVKGIINLGFLPPLSALSLEVQPHCSWSVKFGLMFLGAMLLTPFGAAFPPLPAVGLEVAQTKLHSKKLPKPRTISSA